jgi:hypothetical protein
MVFSHINSKGAEYFLHQKGKLLFFFKKNRGSIDLPSGAAIVENQGTGLPTVKKKQ